VTVWELLNDLLPLGTELTLVYTNKPKQKTPRPRTVVGRHYNAPGYRRNMIVLQCPDGTYRNVALPTNSGLHITERGFAFYSPLMGRYAAYEFTPAVFDDGLD
jgi:hypothetical protein